MGAKNLRFIFLVQAEGRGHMTQAISLFDILTGNGHDVGYVFIGKSKRREVPDFFRNSISSPIVQLDSPNFLTDKDNKSIRLLPTILYNAKFIGPYYRSLKTIHEKVLEYKPDVIINFYDFLGGFYSSLFKPKCQIVSVGHQFLADMPEFPFEKGRDFEKRMFKSNNMLTGQGSHKKLALSFRPYSQMSHKKTVVVPPLIRKEITELKPETGVHILAYMVNDGYGDDIIKWHEKNRDVIVECFWDRKGVENPYKPHKNLTFHQLSGELFKEKMRTCRGYVSTAGFESICEAMYMGKPILMIPVDGQYEQACNAIDAHIAGGGIYNSTFDIQKLIDYIPNHKPVDSWFSEWINSAEEIFIKELTDIKN